MTPIARTTLLIVDDDRSIRELLALHFEEQGHRVLSAATAAEGEALTRDGRPDAILLDVRLPDRSGIDTISSLRELTDAPVLIITGLRDMATTILAMKGGAFDLIPKPLDIRVLDEALSRALEHRRMSLDTHAVEIDPAALEHDRLIGDGPAMRAIYKEIGLIAASRANVLVAGESGTGKELLARVIHQYSDPSRPFIPVNCAAIVESLLESELFGHERGAFTGAVATKLGKCELAGDGTLFLDEIGDLSLSLQAKLLRVLQEREFERVGGSKRLPLRARVIAATHHALDRLVKEGRFREDLYQRLKVVTVTLPALRERPDDIPALIEHLLARINARLGRDVTRVPAEVLTLLQSRPWAGNVRELENVLTRAVVLAPSDVLTKDLFPRVSETEFTPAPDTLPAFSTPLFDPSAKIPTLDDIERNHIAHVLKLTGGHRGRACDILGIARPTLIRKLRKYGLVHL